MMTTDAAPPDAPATGPLGNACDRMLRHRGKVVSVLVGQGITVIGLAVGSRVLTECAAPAALGEYKLAIGFIGLFSGLFFRPFIQFVMRAYHDAVEHKNDAAFLAYAKRIVTRSALLCGAVMFATLAIYGLVSHNVQMLAAPFAGALIYFYSALNFQNGVMITQNRQMAANIIRPIMQCGVPFVAAGGALLLGQAGYSLLIGEFVLLAVLYPVSSRFAGLPVRATVVDVQQQKWSEEARRFVLPLIGVGIFSWVLSVSDRYILAAFASPQEVGLYSAAYGLGSQPILMLTGVTAQILYPFLFSAAAKSRAVAQSQILRYMAFITACCAGAAVAGVALFGDWIVRLLLATEYREGARELLLWVSIGYALLSVAASLEMKNYAAKTTLVVGTSYGIAAATNVVLNLLWIPKLGALGAAKATCFGYATYLAVLVIVNCWRASQRTDSVS